MDVLQRLAETDWTVRLTQLGVHQPDRAPLLDLVEQVRHRPDDVARVQHLADTVLLPYIGDYLGVFAEDRPSFGPDDADHPLMRGALPLVALLVTADDVHEAHRRRGIPADTSWRSLSDLGQQVAKTREVEGRTGSHNQNWLRNVWADGYLWLGRLQLEVQRSQLGNDDAEPVPVINVHIPDDGPLPPEAVDDAFRRAAREMPRYYPELRDAEHLMCQSWLLDPQLQQLAPGSNVAAFQERWRLWKTEPRDRDGYYFVFDIEPEKGRDLPYGIDALPVRSGLQQALVDLWRRGGHVQMGYGAVPLAPYRD